MKTIAEVKKFLKDNFDFVNAQNGVLLSPDELKKASPKIKSNFKKVGKALCALGFKGYTLGDNRIEFKSDDLEFSLNLKYTFNPDNCLQTYYAKLSK